MCCIVVHSIVWYCCCNAIVCFSGVVHCVVVIVLYSFLVQFIALYCIGIGSGIGDAFVFVFVLHCIISNCFVIRCIVFCASVLYCIALHLFHCLVLSCLISYGIVFCGAELHGIVLTCIVLCWYWYCIV